jgi:hypothetical protein
MLNQLRFCIQFEFIMHVIFMSTKLTSLAHRFSTAGTEQSVGEGGELWKNNFSY